MSRKEPKTGFSPKANLGQNDARQQQLSSIQVRHMQGDKAAKLVPWPCGWGFFFARAYRVNRSEASRREAHHFPTGLTRTTEEGLHGSSCI